MRNICEWKKIGVINDILSDENKIDYLTLQNIVDQMGVCNSNTGTLLDKMIKQNLLYMSGSSVELI